METMGCVLSDKNILEELNKGNIVIDPFDARHLSNSSYDVCLDKYFFRNTTKMEYCNIWNKEDSLKYWGEPLVASVAKESEYGLKEGQEYILIHPGETILSCTREFIGSSEGSQITTMMKTRSSIMRSSLSFCKCAGWGDIAFCSKWAVEVTNHGSCKIPLIVGKRVAQIVFLYTGRTENPYKGKYQTTGDLEQLKKEWSPMMLLPRLYDDYDA